MKTFKLSDEQKKKYVYVSDLFSAIETIEKNKPNTEALLEDLEGYLDFCYQTATDVYIREVLLGECSIPLPDSFDDWTDDEKLRLFERWEIINSICYASRVGSQYNEQEDEKEGDLIC